MSEPPATTKQILPLQYLRGVGPKRAEVLAAAGILTPKDLLLYIPRSYIDRSSMGSIRVLQRRMMNPDVFDKDSREGIEALRSEITIVGKFISVREHQFGKGRRMLIATFSDGSGINANIIFWNFVDYYKKTLRAEELYAISGKPDLDKHGKVTFSHPEIERIEPEDEELYKAGKILPKYTITQAMKNAGLTIRIMRQLVETVIEQEKASITEILPPALLRAHAFPERAIAIEALHFPESAEQLRAARSRMKFEELFFFEMMLALRQQGVKLQEKSPVIPPPSPTARALLDKLPFELTNAQKRVIHEIVNDMKSDKPMNRLLQGDVGSGKTIVALLSMLMAVDNGYQALLLAPTEILAEQHYQNIKRLLDGFDINVVQLVGGQKKKVRNEVIDAVMTGKAQMIVGTHALFESTVEYNKVGLIVIDEQHRFGVMQRAKLKGLGTKSHEDVNESEPLSPHVLVMSATPIPRTLSMTVYGDLEVSVIDELPKDRKPIITTVVFESKLPEVYDFIRKEVRKGRQAYIVYPLVEESEKLELKAATLALEELQHEVFPEFRCGLLHGQMFWYEKEDAMRAFLNREYHVLIATTVVEVGIDVPNASVMLIQNAERFGLAQLHQLRGRVGRGSEQSYCLLATKDHFAFHLRKKEVEQQEKLSAIIRLRTMEETTDGFKIAEVDMRLRGPGDVLGTRQSGLPHFVFTDLVNDGDIVQQAKQDAFALIKSDPHLRKSEHQATRREFLRQYSNEGNFLDVA